MNEYEQIFVNILGYDMKIVSYDDGPNDYPQEVWDELKKFPELQYNIGEVIRIYRFYFLTDKKYSQNC